MEKLIVTVAPLGAKTTRAHNPNLPLTPEEVAREVKRCEEAGASVVHLHVRDATGKPTQEKEVFREYIEAILAAGCRVIIQVNTGGDVGVTPQEERLQSIYAHEAIEMATLTPGSVNFGEDVFLNPRREMEAFARAIMARGLKPEVECLDLSHIYNALELMEKGLLVPPVHFCFLMGVRGAVPGLVRELVHFVETLPPRGVTWQVAGISRAELPLALCAIIMGGHVRVGFEDNVYYARGRLAKSNAELVERVVRLAGELGREVASPEEARRILGLKPRQHVDAPLGGGYNEGK